MILKNVRLFSGGADLTGVNNKFELKAEREEKDRTNFGSYDPATGTLWAECVGGLIKLTVSAEGQWEAGDTGKVDDEAWAGLGVVGTNTACPHTADVAALAWLTPGMDGSYQLGGQVGDVAPWQMSGVGSGAQARGVVLHPPGTARTATGNGTAVQHVAVPAGSRLYANLHVLSVSGTTPSLTVKVQSDVDNTFGTPADLITFAAANARGGQALSAAGPVTDTWYRVVHTISGTTPSFLYLCSIGVA